MLSPSYKDRNLRLMALPNLSKMFDLSDKYFENSYGMFSVSRKYFGNSYGERLWKTVFLKSKQNP